MPSEPLTVGWIIDSPFGDFIFESPSPVRKERKPALSGRAVQACPAVNELEKRLFLIKCPFDITLGAEKNGETYNLFFDEERTRVDEDIIGRFVTFMPQKLWRDPQKPVLQLLLPYIFLCDEECYLSQFPPFLHRPSTVWPGSMISGRFPITNWPRIMNFAFEFDDLSNVLALRRGQPLCYLFFEGLDPSRVVKLIHAKHSNAVKEFRKGIDGAPKFTSNTFSLMKEAKIRRPRILVEPFEGPDE
jgi:hypothetical protein